MKKSIFLPVLFTTFLLYAVVSCSLPSSAIVSDSESISFDQVNELFVDEPSSGMVIFKTNDEHYWSANGYTLWALDGDASTGTTSDFVSQSRILSKTSGDAYAGYGIVFCQGENSALQNTMYTVMINTKQQYCIGKVIGAEYSSIQWWTASTSLFSGWGTANQVDVAYDTANDVYTVSLNGTEVYKFANDSEVNDGGNSGYLVVISPYDIFPDTTVEVHYQ